MKRLLIGLSAVLISVFVVILAVNAQDKPQEQKKSGTEVSKDCPKGPKASCCSGMKYGSTATSKTCDHSNCNGKSCDPAKCKAGIYDHSACKSKCATSSGEAKK